MELKESFKKLCILLNKHRVDYIVIGGLAVVYHGYTRTTADFDFWYKPTVTNFHNILKALDEYGVDVSELNNLVFDKKSTYLRIPISYVRAEFLPQIPGLVSFNAAKKNSVLTEFYGSKVYVLGYEELIKNKTAVNRSKDIQDIDELQRRNKSKR